MKKWLMKSEPSTFSIQDLESRGKAGEFWDGVRNYQARNMMRDEMRVGDLAFFYHSNCPVPGIAGIMKVIEVGLPDLTAQNPESRYFDPKATTENPRWFGVKVQWVRTLDSVLSLSEIRVHPELSRMILLRPGNRLSVTPVTDQEWAFLEILLESQNKAR